MTASTVRNIGKFQKWKEVLIIMNDKEKQPVNPVPKPNSGSDEQSEESEGTDND